MSEHQLISKYGSFIYYDAIIRFEEENQNKYFDDLDDSEKINLLDKEMFYDLF